jgi:hypothetical protein
MTRNKEERKRKEDERKEDGKKEDEKKEQEKKEDREGGREEGKQIGKQNQRYGTERTSLFTPSTQTSQDQRYIRKV